jgi:hypothetical protein
MRGHENLALLGPILYRLCTTEEEMSTDDRRAPGATRIPYEGLVEVGGEIGPTFEAKAVNVSEEGIQVRSAYLPEPGQQLTCRFDVGAGQSVLAAGEIAWARGADRGGELGIRFTDMDPESIDALKRVCAKADEAPAAVPAGSKVRLHIEGLASPMRAKIRDSSTNEITVGSELGFLRVGKDLELEDPQSGAKRPACIDSVEVVVDPASQVPQLVVTLRYADVDADAPAAPVATATPAERAPSPVEEKAGDLAAVEEASAKMKGTIARSAARVGPALEQFATRAKTAIALLAKRSREGSGDAAGSPRRTTAPAPGGGLHATGRRVVRGDATSPAGDEAADASNKLKLTRRKAALASAVMIAAVLGALALKKSHHEPAPAATATPASETAGPSTSAALASSAAPPAPTMLATGAASAGLAAAPAAPEPAAPPPQAFGPTASLEEDPDAPRAAHKRHIRVAPFGNGPVHHGNVLHLKMDGPIESLEGAQQPTGFTVKVPGRKSLEAAGPLASRDSRIAAMKVSNDSAGAELTVTFKDGVPNYQVSAHGDVLVLTLAPPGTLEKTTVVAKKDEGGGNGPKRSKADHEKPTKSDRR